MGIASRDAEADRPSLLFVAALVAGLGIGALSFASAPASILLAALPLVLFAVRRKLTVLARVALLVAVGVPVVYLSGTGGGSTANPLLSLPLGSAHPPLQVMLPLLVACAAIISASESQVWRLWFILNRRASGVLVLWVCATAVLVVYGAARNGFAAAGRDLLYMAMYVWVVVPILLFGRMRGRATSLFLPLIVSATAVSAALSLLIFAVRPLKSLVFLDTGLVQYGRVGFSCQSVYPLVLPLCLLILGRRGTVWPAKALWMTSGLLMIAALAVAQSRTTIAVAALNVLLVALVPGLRNVGIERTRMLAWAMVVGIVLSLALVTASLLGFQQARELPQQLSHRLTGIVSFSRVDTYQGRQYTNSVAFKRWLATPSTFLRGEGLGAQVRFYDPVTRRPFDVGPFIDSVWATLAVKGGLVALSMFAAVLIATFAAFVRAARRASDPFDRVVWWALALAFPGLVLESTVMTNHLLAVPAVVVTVATLVAAADLCGLHKTQFVASSRRDDAPAAART